MNMDCKVVGFAGYAEPMPRFERLVAEELRRARTKHPRALNSAHEGYAVLLEEVEELWDEVKLCNRNPQSLLRELVQVGAMARRMYEDVLPGVLMPTDPDSGTAGQPQ